MKVCSEPVSRSQAGCSIWASWVFRQEECEHPIRPVCLPDSLGVVDGLAWKKNQLPRYSTHLYCRAGFCEWRMGLKMDLLFLLSVHSGWYRCVGHLWMLLAPLFTCTSAILMDLVESHSAFTCEPIGLRMCQDLPYNTTFMPNLLNHYDQQTAALAMEVSKSFQCNSLPSVLCGQFMKNSCYGTGCWVAYRHSICHATPK